MNEKDILGQISDLVDEEHRLRGNGALTDDERSRMSHVEAQLDQCWDLLRQRRAKRDFGDDPDQAQVRPEQQVESYLQ